MKNGEAMKIDKGGIINDFIQPNRKQYVIPVYQRNYEWAEEHCTKLFEDIVAAHRADKYHFTGSVVYAQLESKNKIDTYVIIDGQQRLTTIYLLIKALIDCAEDENDKDVLTNVVFNVDKFKKYDIDNSSKLKLKPIKSDNQQLMLLMEDKLDSVDKNSGIFRNYSLFKQLITDCISENPDMDVQKIYDGLEHLTCATIKLEDEDNAQEIFDRINSTGMPLSLADKIRNLVLMTDAEQDRLYEEYWLKAETLVGYKKLTSFFLDYLNIKVDGFPKESEAYDVFRKMYEENGYSNEQILKEILHYAEFYHTFLYGSKKYSSKVNKCLENLRRLNQSTVYVFLFRVFDDYHNPNESHMTETELEKVLQFLLNYTIRRMVCEIGSNSLRGLYKTLYARVFNRPENKNNYYDSIVSFFIQLASRDVLIKDDEFKQGLKYNNLYKKNAVCKLLLTSIENEGKEQLITDNLTIEHIMPQNKNLSSTWQNMLGTDWEEIKEKYLHTLGNLTLTGYNSELGDKPFAEKKNLLSSVHTKVVALYEDVKDCDRWNKDTIEERAENLADKIIALYPIEMPAHEVSFKDPRYTEYTCENPDDATSKTPNYYVLQGERVVVGNFALMLRLIIEQLYEMDPSIIEGMARENNQLLSWSKMVLFSYSEDEVYGDYRIKGTNIYQSTGFSASHTMSIIKALLEKYEIDTDDFIYSARDTVPQKADEK